jgi:hypothetical protein
MAISIVVSPGSPTEISSTTRTLKTVNATITATGDAGEIIQSVLIELEENEPGVTILNGITSSSINGTYIDPFEDSFTYVERGSSNLIETPKTVIGTENLPPKKDYFILSQDTREESIRHYNVTVISSGGSNSFEVTHSIYNEWEGIRSFVDNYYD